MTQQERIKAYENILHALHYARVANNHQRITELLNIISDWSHAHHAGNGEYTPKQARDNINQHARKMQTT